MIFDKEARNILENKRQNLGQMVLVKLSAFSWALFMLFVSFSYNVLVSVLSCYILFLLLSFRILFVF